MSGLTFINVDNKQTKHVAHLETRYIALELDSCTWHGILAPSIKRRAVY
jgi:hypothetical protein